jgi:enoyl-CoA hydratase
MSYNTILTETEGKVAIITLNRPQVLNALNDELMNELGTALLKFDADDSIACMIITGSEKAFAAGADISEFGGPEDAARIGASFHAALNAVAALPCFTIAAVSGFALGGGCELAMSCHFVIASESAVFGQPEVNLGIMVGYGGSQRLTQRVGKGRAMELIITGKTINATQAMNYGLANYVVPQTELLDKALSILKVCHEKSPIAVGNSIKAINAVWDENVNGYEVEANLFGECFVSGDSKEGIAAFKEKRKPHFKGH